VTIALILQGKRAFRESQPAFRKPFKEGYVRFTGAVHSVFRLRNTSTIRFGKCWRQLFSRPGSIDVIAPFSICRRQESRLRRSAEPGRFQAAVELSRGGPPRCVFELLFADHRATAMGVSSLSQVHLTTERR